VTLRKTGAAAPAFAGQSTLLNYLEWVMDPGYNVAAVDVAIGGYAYGRVLPAMFNAGNPVAVWNARGNQTAFFRVVNDISVVDVFAIAGAIGGQECAHIFRPSNGPGPSGQVDFPADFTPVLEQAPGTGAPRAAFFAAWMRKRLAGDATSCAQFFGFANDNGDLNFSRRVARIGIMGDGALGFRFGSVNCPDAPAGGNDNAPGDIDADSFQPTILNNPGASWFHVRIKAVPGVPGVPARFGCYLSGRLVKVYTAVANFPHTSRSGIDVSGAAYWPIAPVFAAFGNGGAAPSPGYYLRDIRAGFTDDLTL
jgi:hypothetical protein